MEVAIEIAQRAFELPESMPLGRLQRFARTLAAEKPKQGLAGRETLAEFLQYVCTFCTEAGGTLVEENDEDNPVAVLEPTDLRDETGRDAVQLMTVHAAKGLEFRRVFVVRDLVGSQLVSR